MRVLDLFSAAAGGWSLGLHRAGFQTVAACEWIEWRRALYAENNPGVLIYDDVRTLTGARLLADLGALPDLIVGSPPCQDISSANTKGKGVDGERSGLFFEAVRIIGEVRPRWFALENSANLRTRGSDAVLAALEGVGYTAWAFVVGAGDGKIAAGVGANHDRARSWLIGYDVGQLANANMQSVWWPEQSGPQGEGRNLPGLGAFAGDFGGENGAGSVSGRLGGLGEAPIAPQVGHPSWAGDSQGADAGCFGRLAGHDDGHGFSADADGFGRDEGRSRGWSGLDLSVSQNPFDPSCLGHEGGRSRRYGPDGDGAASVAGGAGSPADPDQAGQAEITNYGRGPGRSDDRSLAGQVGLRPSDRIAAFQHRADWSLDDLARHIRLDDGLPAWLAEQRIAVGSPRGTSAASLIVEAFGDAVLPQIPEAIGRAILRVEAAMAAVARPERLAA